MRGALDRTQMSSLPISVAHGSTTGLEWRGVTEEKISGNKQKGPFSVLLVNHNRKCLPAGQSLQQSPAGTPHLGSRPMNTTML